MRIKRAGLVIKLNREHPDWTAADIAKAVGCNPGYVRATGQRKLLTFAVLERPKKAPIVKIKREKKPAKVAWSAREELAAILFEFFDEFFLDNAVFEKREPLIDEFRYARKQGQSITGFLMGDPLPGRSALK